MLTNTAGEVDDTPIGDGEEGLWLSISALAEAHDVSKQSVSQNIERWVANGRSIRTKRRGRELLVNVAEYDAAKGDLVDSAHLLAERTKKKDQTNTDPVYAREQARRSAYEADLKFIELQKALGQYVDRQQVVDAAMACASEMIRTFDEIDRRAEEMVASVTKDGIIGMRAELRRLKIDLRTAAEQAFARLAAGERLSEGGEVP